MIYVERIAAPKTLVKNAGRWTEEYLAAVKRHAKSPNDPKLKRARKTAEIKYNHKSIRKALGEDMFSGKCVYCESSFAKHIEHYRPKSKWPKRCFVWENLHWACGDCNGPTYKGDRFPKTAEGGPFLNPTKDHPERHLDFEYDEETGIAAIGFKTKRGQTTRDQLGLNRSELLKVRSENVGKTAYLATQAAKGDPKAVALLRRACDKGSPYAAFARTIASRFGIDWKT